MLPGIPVSQLLTPGGCGGGACGAVGDAAASSIRSTGGRPHSTLVPSRMIRRALRARQTFTTAAAWHPAVAGQAPISTRSSLTSGPPGATASVGQPTGGPTEGSSRSARRSSALDPVESEIDAWLTQQPELSAVAILGRLRALQPGVFDNLHVRTVQRVDPLAELGLGSPDLAQEHNRVTRIPQALQPCLGRVVDRWVGDDPAHRRLGRVVTLDHPSADPRLLPAA